MTTLDTKAGTESQNTEAPRSESAPAPAVEQSTGTAALITEQQVLFGSAAALAPARHRNVAAELSSKVRAMFTRPEKSHAPKHYPQRYTYLERSALSREMDRL